MIGREGLPFDRGKLLSFLWPPFCFFLDQCLLHWPVCLFVLLLFIKLLKWLWTWWKHFQLASLIAEWHRSELDVLMKAHGFKPSRSPLPKPLVLLPSNLMVLSGIMLLMSRVGMAAPLSLSPPVTWVEALGGVRGLHESLPFTHPPPPEPPPWLSPPPPPPTSPPDSPSVTSISIDGAGDEDSEVIN